MNLPIAGLLAIILLTITSCGGRAMPAQQTTDQGPTPTAVQLPAPAREPPVSPPPTPTPPAGAVISPIETPAPPGSVMDSGATGREVTGSLDGAVIIYQRSGGIAGISERWMVYPDGRVLQPDGQIRQVPPDQISTLLSKIESLGFFDMKNEYLPENPCCDRFTHTLTVRRDDQSKHVTTLDATPDAPAALWEAIDAVTQLAGSGS